MRSARLKSCGYRNRVGVAVAFALLIAVAYRRPTVAATPPSESKLPPAATMQVDFVKDIQPLFESHCYSCHGPKKQESGLRLDDDALAQNGGDLGPAYAPGKSGESALVQYIAGADENILMPPEDSNIARFTSSEIGLIRAWIDQGAKRPAGAVVVVKPTFDPKAHWAFQRPVRPKSPTVKAADWPLNPIDSFVLSKLEEASLAPAPEADRTTLIRRLSLDLTGLPPTMEEVQRFVNDTSPNAYERLVDRLLESPHYGERWAMWWLDMARYADTNGYEIDRPRSIWLYRDWVVSALNANMPFNQFAIEQMAGDLLPNATQSQLIATGFHRNTFINEEGGHNWEQFRWESIVDRVNTTSTIFLGLTMACAQCHDHKYDPISQREYYQFFAFLNNDDEPLLEVPTPDVTKEREHILAQIARLESKLASRFPTGEGSHQDPDNLSTKFEEWRQQTAAETRHWTPLEPVRWASEHNVSFTKLDDKSLLANGDNPEVDTYDVTYKAPAGKITGIRLEAMTDVSLPLHGPGRGYLKDDGTFFLSEFGVTTHKPGSDGKVTDRPLKLVHPTASIHQEVIAKTLDGEKLTGWHIRGGPGRRHCAVFEFAKPLSVTEGEELTVKLMQNFAHQQTLGRFRMWVTTDAAPLVATDIPLDVEDLMFKAPADWSTADTDKVKAYYLSVAPELKKEQKQIGSLEKRLPAQPTTLVLKHRDSLRVTHQHIRGDFARPGAEVRANVPNFLPPLPTDAPRDRLTLARWLVSDQNPLVARVIMNQIWQCYFGRGLVDAPENFGSQGTKPSNPELLDWLACQFMEDGWDLKQIHRAIVTSSTYRQSCATTPEKLQRDPENILLSRGARFRLPAESVRDVSLAASGLLNTELGGPSIFTPQPAAALAGVFGDPKWPTATGIERFRRAIYTHRKRTAPYAAFAAFDAPPNNLCVMRRVRSNTPLQALAQLNDEMMIEASQALARRIMAEEPGDETTRLNHAFQLCLTRTPRPEERDALLAYFHSQQKGFRTDKADAAAIAGISDADKDRSGDVADLAAWTLVSRALLNLDEALSKE